MILSVKMKIMASNELEIVQQMNGALDLARKVMLQNSLIGCAQKVFEKGACRNENRCKLIGTNFNLEIASEI